jgi:hypothetical protein
MKLPDNVITKLNDINAFSLAYHADVANPDSLDSPGAKMLTRILADVVERVEYLDSLDDTSDADDLRDALAEELDEVADSAPDVYTGQRWLQFVDLAGYSVDLSELGEIDGNNVTDDVAGRALFLIARDVADACVTLVSEAMSEHIAAATKKAASIGGQHGINAADWYCQEIMGGRAPGDAAVTARKILAGIDDGDPAVLDSLPFADLSGEQADALTVAGLLADVDLAGFDIAGMVAEEVADAYEDAFRTAAVDTVERIARDVVGAAD